jgi:twitching motility protein PilI
LSTRTRESLRDFQARLADRLKAAQAKSGSGSKLGFLAGGRNWLVDLGQVNEVVTVPELTAIPWAKPWFAGVANVRGVIYGCTDLAAFLGLGEPLPGGESRLLLANPDFGLNAAWRVDRALGLRSVERLKPSQSAQGNVPWAGGHWRDDDGTEWTEINFEYLLAQAEFLDAGR